MSLLLTRCNLFSKADTSFISPSLLCRTEEGH